jgi:hypothetical protein
MLWPCCLQFATTVSIRSTNRLPFILSVPPLIRRQITACRNARSTALFVGVTRSTRAKLHRPSSTLRSSNHVAAVFAHGRLDPSRRVRLTSRRKRQHRSFVSGTIDPLGRPLWPAFKESRSEWSRFVIARGRYYRRPNVDLPFGSLNMSR